MSIIDTHNHLYFPGFKDSFEQVLEVANNAGVTQQILIGIDELSCQAALNLAQKNNRFKVALGLHPCDVDQLGQYDPKYHQYLGIDSQERPKIKTHNEYFQWLDKIASQNPDTVVAFGETGFDQFHRQSEALLNLQTESFEAHLALCQQHQKTLIIHSRGARDETLKFIEERAEQFKKINFVWHCFTEDAPAATTVLDLGGYLGVGGVITYPKSEALRNVIKAIPLDRIVTETDAPFLTPHMARKKHKLNQPQFIPEIINTIAHLKTMETAKVETQLFKNAQKAFSLSEA